MLRIGTTTIEASGRQLKSSPGQQLKLEVIQTEPRALLKVVGNPPTSQAETEMLKYLMPRQLPLRPLLGNLVLLSNEGHRSSGILPHSLLEQIRKTIRNIPSEKKVSDAAGIKRALLLSGLFLENKLITAASIGECEDDSIDQDIKGNLLRLLYVLRRAMDTRSAPPTPAKGHQPSSQIMEELLHQVNGAIARLHINQITSLSSEGNTAPVLSFELPLRVDDRIDVIQMSIFRDQQSHTEENQNRWSASISMEMENLGIIYATVTFSQEQVWTTLWAERQSTVDAIKQHLQELNKGYNEAGLQIGATYCRLGTPPPAAKKSPKVYIDDNA